MDLWTARLTSQEAQGVDDPTSDEMIDELEEAWAQIKLRHAIPKGEQP